MAIIKRNKLLRYEPRRGLSVFHEQQKYLKKTASARATTVFLSHSSRDKELVEKVSAILWEYVANVYIDWEDAEIPQKPSYDTARILKKRIETCNKFMMIASDNALKEARWVPWELGIADSVKGFRNIAIFPVCADYNNWYGNEYVNLYHIVEEIPEDSGNWIVRPNQLISLTDKPLGEWLRRPG